MRIYSIELTNGMTQEVKCVEVEVASEEYVFICGEYDSKYVVAIYPKRNVRSVVSKE